MRRHRSDYKYFLTYRTRWSDNDQYAHVNNAVYYYLIDSIVNTYLEERCGCSPRGSAASGNPSTGTPPIGLVITSQCTFHSPLAFPQVIVLGLRVKKLGRSSVTYEVGFFPEGDESAQASAVGGYTHVFVDRASRKTLREGMGHELKTGLQAIYTPLEEGELEKGSPKSNPKL